MDSRRVFVGSFHTNGAKVKTHLESGCRLFGSCFEIYRSGADVVALATVAEGAQLGLYDLHDVGNTFERDL